MIPAVVVPGLTVAGLYLWPFLEQWATGDRGEHHLLDRPRDRPARTAIGVTALTFYGILFLAGSDDVLAVTLGIPIRTVVWWFRVGVLVLPLAVGVLTYLLLSGWPGEIRSGVVEGEQ